MPTLINGNSSGGQNGVIVFRKSRKAMSLDDYETWVQDETANTLNTFEGGDTRAVTLAVTDENDSN